MYDKVKIVAMVRANLRYVEMQIVIVNNELQTAYLNRDALLIGELAALRAGYWSLADSYYNLLKILLTDAAKITESGENVLPSNGPRIVQINPVFQTPRG